MIASINGETATGFFTNVQPAARENQTGAEENQNSGHDCRRRLVFIRSRNRTPLLNRATGLAYPGPGFQKGDLPTGETTIMDKFVTDRAARPASAKHSFVPIEIFLAHPAESRQNWKRHRLPLTASFSNTHKSGSIAGRPVGKQARDF